MPGVRKRENRENQFYNVGEQGRKTGITLEDKGLRDEYGMEPVSGIFSSPEKSPPKRGAGEQRIDATVTESESMDIQESSIPDLTPGHILRNSRTSLPPPRSRSPMKTSLGATPRRSLGPLRSSNQSSSPNSEVSSAVNRRLAFDQEETSLQETPALNRSGGRRGAARRNVYDMEESPIPGNSMQEEITAADDESAIMTQLAEEDSYAGAVEPDEQIEEANGAEESLQEEEVTEEVVKLPMKRGRKRKSEALESAADADSPRTSSRKTRGKNSQQESSEKATGSPKPVAPKPRGRPPKAKQPTPPAEEQPSFASNAAEEDEVEDTAPPQRKKPRGRPPRKQPQAEDATEESPQADKPGSSKGRRGQAKNQTSKQGSSKPDDQSTFKKPKAVAKSKSKASESATNLPEDSPEQYVDFWGKPLPKEEVDQRSATSAASRFSRARSIFCERKAEDLATTVTRTGRRNIKPINFWRNERAAYDRDGNLIKILENKNGEEDWRKSKSKGRKKKRLAAVDEEEEELEEWETGAGVLTGRYRDYDAATETTKEDEVEAVLAWASKGIETTPVANGQFKFCKLGSAGGRSAFSWGCIDMDEDDIKRSKNSRRMQMVFTVMEGAVEVMVADSNVFTVHKGGVWQVPRGNNYSITNVAKKTRIFFCQAMETVVEAE